MATVQLFASFAEHFGAASVEVPITKGTTVRELIQRIRSLSGSLVIPDAARIAINHEFASDDAVIAANDEIALIPPVAGG
jgi:molybdopterin converting factor subunit 1